MAKKKEAMDLNLSPWQKLFETRISDVRFKAIC